MTSKFLLMAGLLAAFCVGCPDQQKEVVPSVGGELPSAGPSRDNTMANPVDGTPDNPTKPSVTVIAVRGAVVTTQREGRVTYLKKCERCGAVSSGATDSPAPGAGSALKSSFTCSKCKNHQPIELRGQR
jgi:hypothetical protein